MWSFKKTPKMFTLFEPKRLIEVAPEWGEKVDKTYLMVFGFSSFAHLFVCSETLDSFSLIITERPELIELKMSSREDFASKFLDDSKARVDFFKEPDYLTLFQKLGAPQSEECFYPVPYPPLGGSGKLETYQRGNLWVHLSIYGQTLGY